MHPMDDELFRLQKDYYKPLWIRLEFIAMYDLQMFKTLMNYMNLSHI